jgi:hypothetical protein
MILYIIWLANATIGPNGRRYVQLPQHRGGVVFGIELDDLDISHLLRYV